MDLIDDIDLEQHLLFGGEFPFLETLEFVTHRLDALDNRIDAYEVGLLFLGDDSARVLFLILLIEVVSCGYILLQEVILGFVMIEGLE